jgi:hypothetical protein
MNRTDSAHDQLAAKIDELKKDLPRISFGYIGNYEFNQDYTTWYIFLPHSGRVGKYSDSVYIGEGRDADKFTKALANWDKLEAACRRQYAADPYRLAEAVLRDGVLYEKNGTRLLSAQYGAPIFKSVEEAENWLATYQYPAVVERS